MGSCQPGWELSVAWNLVTECPGMLGRSVELPRWAVWSEISLLDPGVSVNPERCFKLVAHAPSNLGAIPNKPLWLVWICGDTKHVTKLSTCKALHAQSGSWPRLRLGCTWLFQRPMDLLLASLETWSETGHLGVYMDLGPRETWKLANSPSTENYLLPRLHTWTYTTALCMAWGHRLAPTTSDQRDSVNNSCFLAALVRPWVVSLVATSWKQTFALQSDRVCGAAVQCWTKVLFLEHLLEAADSWNLQNLNCSLVTHPGDPLA